ncbi:uncharacterized protein CTRU02_213440 [Colletotrichum truncatum]|uniref:Uncharacterized protein n=1 Tax=Colletotrichum truncatum TaxID=5467 RepID=A0ACC3YKX5_COLTU|nr:uncharacterized protein CTRU02_13434 [Colletotrichum truncatum]KAF6783444.1 hypothetical protein CTRU02_13434 [Colletotrichum truncatum]
MTSTGVDVDKQASDTPKCTQTHDLTSNLPAEWKDVPGQLQSPRQHEHNDCLDLLGWDWHDSDGPLDGPDDTSSLLNEIPTRDILTTGYPPNHGSSQGQMPSPPSDSDSSDTESTEELIDRLSDRVGSLQIGSDGQIRYYGPTSNFNLVHMPAPDNMTVHRTVRNDGQEYLDRLNIGKEVPNSIEEHLVNLYFTWQDPASHVVQRDMYERAQVQWRDGKFDTPYYSEALRNSICALGAAFESRHHPTFVTFPKSLSDFFADRAKALLEIELDCPTVATVQAMVVLRMAMRLAFDLALHVDMTPYVEKRSISQAEADLRKTVFWGAYTVDHLWGFHLGRPFRISMEGVTVAKPGSVISDKPSGQWSSYTSLASPGSPMTDYSEDLSRQRALLCEIMAPLGYSLYGSQKIPSPILQEMNERTVKELTDWRSALPSVLQVNLNDADNSTPYLPHVLLLHMHYFQAIIHAHRPWMSKHYIQPQPPRGPGYNHARKACIEAAVAIAKLLQLYEDRYTLRRMNIQGVTITCSAALLLIFATVSHIPWPEYDNLAVQLGTCFRALDEFSPSWENAKRAHDFLVMLQRQWGVRAKSNRTRRQSTATCSSQTPRKRLRKDSESDLAANGDSPSSTSQPVKKHQHNWAQFQPATEAMGAELGIDLDWIFAVETSSGPEELMATWEISNLT